MFKSKSKTSGAAGFVPVWANATGVKDGDEIESVQGRVVSIFEPREARKTTVQNATLETPDGTIKVAFWGNDLPLTLKGQTILITGSNDKWGKIVYEINSYKGKKGEVTEEVLKVGNKADIEEVDAAAQGSRQEAAAHGMERPAKSAGAPPRASEAPSNSAAASSLVEVVEAVVEQHVVINDMVRLAYAKKNLDESTLAAYVATVFINVDRAGHILHFKREDEPAKEAPKEQFVQFDPQNWAEAIVPSGSLAGKSLAAVGKPAILKMEAYRKDNSKTGGFWDCVKQAAVDLSWEPADDAGDDDLPM